MTDEVTVADDFPDSQTAARAAAEWPTQLQPAIREVRGRPGELAQRVRQALSNAAQLGKDQP